MHCLDGEVVYTGIKNFRLRSAATIPGSIHGGSDGLQERHTDLCAIESRMRPHRGGQSGVPSSFPGGQMFKPISVCQRIIRIAHLSCSQCSWQAL